MCKRFFVYLFGLTMLFNTLAYAGDLKYGDVDMSGTLTASDAAAVLSYVLNSEENHFDDEQINAALVGGGAVISASDAALILQKVLNDTFAFPVEAGQATTETATETTEVTTETATVETTTETTTEAPGSKNSVELDGFKYYIGQSVNELPAPDRVDASIYGGSTYVYNSDYLKLVIIEVSSAGTVQGIIIMTKEADKLVENINLSNDCTINLMSDPTAASVYALELKSVYLVKPKTQSAEALAGIEKQVFDLTNAFRAQNDVYLLLWSDDAALVAKNHSIDMFTRQYFSHIDPDGNTVGKRFDAAGVNWSYCSENLAVGHSSALKVVDAWVNSTKGHRENLLNVRSVYLGVGCHYSETDDARYYWYYTQNFYMPL